MVNPEEEGMMMFLLTVTLRVKHNNMQMDKMVSFSSLQKSFIRLSCRKWTSFSRETLQHDYSSLNLGF